MQIKKAHWFQKNNSKAEKRDRGIYRFEKKIIESVLKTKYSLKMKAK